VVQFIAAGMFRFREVIKAALAAEFPGSRIVWFADEHAERQESFVCPPQRALPPVIVQEHGVKFRVHPGGKHKTGFFCDQRGNRRRLADFCAGQRVLDLCCNSGGFAVYAKTLGEAAEVTAIDLDEEALASARNNARLNQAEIRFERSDIFPWLRAAAERGERYDVVVLDPAKLTRDRDEVINALKKYLDMNKLALAVVKPGGLLLSCSCTGLVDEPSFLDMLRRAAFYAGRDAQVLEVRGAGADHPWRAQVPEGRYLKAVLLRVG
jgi:23S rRNA (cytosine1962-C5)-methyltransferase